MNLRTKLSICALQHARYLSDMEGGELSRKMIRKVQAAGEALPPPTLCRLREPGIHTTHMRS